MCFRCHSIYCASLQLSGGSRYPPQLSTRACRGSLSLKIFSAFIVCVGVSLFRLPLSAADIHIYFKASPRLELLHPYSDPATLTLLVTGADGKPVSQGRLAIRLEAPAPGWFFSTDFPLVEGSRLLEMSLPLKQGRAEWRYLFPIRGEYRLSVEFTSPDGNRATETFTVGIPESKQKWVFLGIFSLALFAAGVIAGRIFTSSRSRPARKMAAGLVFLLGSLVASIENTTGQEVERGGQVGWLEIDPAIVGKPTKLRWRLAGETNAESQVVLLSLTIAHLEKGKTVFSFERLPIAREFTVNFQFADGADYRVTAIARVGDGRMLRTERNVFVTGVEPPVRAIIPAIGFFLAVIALGLAVGRWSRRTAPFNK